LPHKHRGFGGFWLIWPAAGKNGSKPWNVRIFLLGRIGTSVNVSPDELLMITEIVMLATGLVIGVVAVWFILKVKIQAAADKAKAEGEAERAGLNATLQARDSQIQVLLLSATPVNNDLRDLRDLRN
jgi:hypothetical protein